MFLKKVVTVLAGILLLGGCSHAPQKQTVKLRVLTTLQVLADWVSQVGGDRVQVASLLTGNEDPHTHELKPADVKAVADARILFRVGLGLEDWLDPAIVNSGNKKLDVVDVAAGITDIIGGEEHQPKSGAPGSPPQTAAFGNPHIWLDPELAKTSIDNLTRELVKVDPAGETLYRRREAAYFVRLDSLKAAITAELGGLSDRRLISFHDAWPYFARRFGLDIVATVEPIPGQEPSAREMARLVDLIRQQHIKVVTSEPQMPSSLPDMLAKETGVKVIVMNPLEAGGGYIETMRADADAIERGFLVPQYNLVGLRGPCLTARGRLFRIQGQGRSLTNG